MRKKTVRLIAKSLWLPVSPCHVFHKRSYHPTITTHLSWVLIHQMLNWWGPLILDFTTLKNVSWSDLSLSFFFFRSLPPQVFFYSKNRKGSNTPTMVRDTWLCGRTTREKHGNIIPQVRSVGREGWCKRIPKDFLNFDGSSVRFSFVL